MYRDLREELSSNFQILMAALTKVTGAVAQSGGDSLDVKAPNPELTGVLFEAISYLLKFVFCLMIAY